MQTFKSVVSRNDYNIPQDWFPKATLGKDFWHVIQATWDRKEIKVKLDLPGISNEKMIRESGFRLSTHGEIAAVSLVTENAEMLFENNDKRLLKRPFHISPFVRYYNGITFGIRKDLIPDKNKAALWLKRHKKTCLGFYLGEWGNDFDLVANLRKDYSDTHKLLGWKTHKDIAEELKKRFPVPETKKEAHRMLRREFDMMKDIYYGKIFLKTCVHLLNHFGLEWGAPAAWIEITGSSSHQISIAFCRGAARQYNKPWGVYIALYAFGPQGEGAAPDHLDLGKKHLGPDFGVSPSLNKRNMYISYMSGANFLDHESEPEAFAGKNKQGKYILSSHGQAVKEWYAFTQRHPDRGIPYTPVGLLIDYYDCRQLLRRRTWHVFPYQDGDWMIDEFLQTLFAWERPAFFGEANGNCLANSPFGDIYDILHPNPPSGIMDLKALSNYKVLILMGDITINKKFALRLMEYVRKGGTLIINANQVNKYFSSGFLGVKLNNRKSCKGFEAARCLLDGKTLEINEHYEVQGIDVLTAQVLIEDGVKLPLVLKNKSGRGNVILTTPFYMLDEHKNILPIVSHLMKHVVKEVLPFKINGDIEYLLNRKKDGWIITLVNNKGVYKRWMTPAEIKPEETTKVALIFEKAVKEAGEWTEEKKIPCIRKKNSTIIEVEVPPGEVRVIEVIQGSQL